MAKKRKFTETHFVIRPAKNGQSWSVYLITKYGRSIEAYEFASEKSARNWIDYESRGWLRKREAVRDR
jgi:hypothetical protein